MTSAAIMGRRIKYRAEKMIEHIFKKVLWVAMHT